MLWKKNNRIQFKETDFKDNSPFFYCLSYEGTPMRWTNNTMNEFDITMSSLNTRRRPFISVMTVNECIFLHIFQNI